MKPLITERLIIRPVVLDDAAFFLSLINTPDYHRFIRDRKINTIEQVQSYIKEKMLSQYQRLRFGNNVIIRKKDQASIGSIGIYARPGINTYDIGFAMLPAYYKRGYGYEAAKALINHWFNTQNGQPLYAITSDENVASRALISKLGFSFFDYTKLEEGDPPLRRYKIDHIPNNISFKPNHK